MTRVTFDPRIVLKRIVKTPLIAYNPHRCDLFWCCALHSLRRQYSGSNILPLWTAAAMVVNPPQLFWQNTRCTKICRLHQQRPTLPTSLLHFRFYSIAPKRGQLQLRGCTAKESTTRAANMLLSYLVSVAGPQDTGTCDDATKGGMFCTHI